MPKIPLDVYITAPKRASLHGYVTSSANENVIAITGMIKKPIEVNDIIAI